MTRYAERYLFPGIAKGVPGVTRIRAGKIQGSSPVGVVSIPPAGRVSVCWSLCLLTKAHRKTVLVKTTQFFFFATLPVSKYRRYQLQPPAWRPMIVLGLSEQHASGIFWLTDFTSHPPFVAADVEYARIPESIHWEER